MFNFVLQGKFGELMAPVQSQEAQLLIAIQNRQPDKIRELLEVKGVGANNANDRGVRPMHVACQTGNSHLVQRLLELGADIITADKAGNTPLHYASKGGYTDMVKMLVGQGAIVEQRNASKLTAYDVATDHVIRQFLLPLQLKAEAGNPDYAVNHMGITSSAPRNFEYGVPGMASSSSSSQPYGHPHGGGAGGAGESNSMDAALGALMQAPSMGPFAPRPGGMAPPTGMAPVNPYPGAGGFSGNPPQRPGSYSPPGDGRVGVGGNGAPPAGSSATSFAPPPPAVAVSLPLPTPSGAPSTMATSPPFEPSAMEPRSPQAPFPGAGAAATTTPARTAVGSNAAPSVPPGSPRAATAAGGPRSFSGVAVQLVASPTPAVAAAGTSSSPAASPGTAGADGAVRPPFEEESLQPGAAAESNSSAYSSSMSTMDLSSRFQTDANVSSGVAEGFSAGASSGTGTAPLPPPGSIHPTSAPNSGTARTAPPPPKPRNFKLIKPDGFHSSASDKVLQERYGHTPQMIMSNLGAPPTAAQLGGMAPADGRGHMVGPPIPLPGASPNNGYAQQAYAYPQYGIPPQQAQGQGYYGQPPQAQGYRQAPPPPRPSNLGGGSAPSSGGVRLPMPGRYAPGAGSAQAGGDGAGVGGYGGVFNSTTTVVAADSTSNAVL